MLNKEKILRLLERDINLDVGDAVYDKVNHIKTEVVNIHILVEPDNIRISYILQSDLKVHHWKDLIKYDKKSEKIIDDYKNFVSETH